MLLFKDVHHLATMNDAGDRLSGVDVLIDGNRISRIAPAIPSVEGARVIDTAPLTLPEIIAEMVQAHSAGKEIARVHSGDPSLYGAIAEQMRQLDDHGIPYDVTPGVPAFAAAAAALNTELTLPEVAQTIILTRTAMKASPMPAGEDLARLGASGATLAIHLSVRNLRHVVEALTPHYGADCPVAVVYRASWPDQLVLRGTLADIRAQVRAAKITRTALVLVGRVLEAAGFGDSNGVVYELAGIVRFPALYFVSAHFVDALRCESYVAKNGYAVFDNSFNGWSADRTAFKFNGPGPGFFNESTGIFQCLFNRDLV